MPAALALGHAQGPGRVDLVWEEVVGVREGKAEREHIEGHFAAPRFVSIVVIRAIVRQLLLDAMEMQPPDVWRRHE